MSCSPNFPTLTSSGRGGGLQWGDGCHIVHHSYAGGSREDVNLPVFSYETASRERG
jgi:hypothetical protein